MCLTVMSIMGEKFPVSRRKFIQTATTAALAAPFILESCAGKEILNHVSIGVGGMMGLNDLKSFLSHPKINVVAICDVDKNMLKVVREEVEKLNGDKPKLYGDYRELISNYDWLERAVMDQYEKLSTT